MSEYVPPGSPPVIDPIWTDKGITNPPGGDMPAAEETTTGQESFDLFEEIEKLFELMADMFSALLAELQWWNE